MTALLATEPDLQRLMVTGPCEVWLGRCGCWATCSACGLSWPGPGEYVTAEVAKDIARAHAAGPCGRRPRSEVSLAIEQMIADAPGDW